MSNTFSLLDDYNLELRYLDEDLELICPDYSKNVSGILPELIRSWNVENQLKNSLSGKSTFPSISKKIQENHPSGYDNIILFLVDGMGINNLSDTNSSVYDLIVSQKGEIASSTFPTITSTVMTSIMYGVLPGSHGLVGYNIYNEELASIWNALRLRYLDEENNLRLVLDDINLDQIVSGTSLTQTIDSFNLPIVYFVPDYLRPPGLGTILNPTFPQQGYSSHSNLLSQVKKYFDIHTGQKFMCVYFPDLDGAAHRFGVGSLEYLQTLSVVEQTINRIMAMESIKQSNTLGFLTSDHGLSNLDHSTTPMMSKQKWNKLKDNGTLLSFSGRTVHAYSTDGNINQTRQTLESLVNSKKSLILDRNASIELAGGSTEFSRRIGDFTVVSASDYMFHVPNCLSTDMEAIDLGHHGSLTLDELFVPAVILPSGH